MTFMRVDVATSVYEGEISSNSRVRHFIRFLVNFQVSEWLYLVQYGNFEKVGVFLLTMTGADRGFFLGGGALVSCSTSRPINHIVFLFCRIPVVLENRRSPEGGGVRTPCTLPLDPPLYEVRVVLCC